MRLICGYFLIFRYLDNNLLETMDDGVFDYLYSLVYLTATSNQLTHFPGFDISSSLWFVDLSSNNIETIAQGSFSITDTPALSYMYVLYNLI